MLKKFYDTAQTNGIEIKYVYGDNIVYLKI